MHWTIVKLANSWGARRMIADFSAAGQGRISTCGSSWRSCCRRRRCTARPSAGWTVRAASLRSRTASASPNCGASARTGRPWTTTSWAAASANTTARASWRRRSVRSGSSTSSATRTPSKRKKSALCSFFLFTPQSAHFFSVKKNPVVLLLLFLLLLFSDCKFCRPVRCRGRPDLKLQNGARFSTSRTRWWNEKCTCLWLQFCFTCLWHFVNPQTSSVFAFTSCRRSWCVSRVLRVSAAWKVISTPKLFFFPAIVFSPIPTNPNQPISSVRVCLCVCVRCCPDGPQFTRLLIFLWRARSCFVLCPASSLQLGTFLRLPELGALFQQIQTRVRQKKMADGGSRKTILFVPYIYDISRSVRSMNNRIFPTCVYFAFVFLCPCVQTQL